jgi:hypothetical protein
MATPPAVDQLRMMVTLLSSTGHPSSLGDRAAARVSAALASAVDGVGGPMRLAVTGQITRGKSTLINALTRREVAETGVDEVTADFHEFRIVESGANTEAAPGGPAARRPGSRRRAPAHLVRTVAAELPADLRLIDTPGLGSPVNDTAGNAGLRADCALHLFERSVHHTDVDYLRVLLARDGTQPLPTRVLGVLSACDRSWPPALGQAAADPLTYDPLRDYADGVLRQVERNPVNQELFYAVVPVAALVAEGGWALTSRHVEALADLTKRYDARALAGHLRSKAGFVGADLDVDEDSRRELMVRLGQWGIHLACSYLSDPASTEAGLRAYLDERSGVARLRAAVVTHFVDRATSIKLEQHLRGVEKVLADARTQLRIEGMAMPAALLEVGRRLELLRTGNVGLQELALVELIHRYEHRLTPTEAAQLDELTGGGGPSVMARLGLPAGAELRLVLDRAVARHRHWSRRELALPNLAPAVVRAYERLIGRISQAQALLDGLD